MHFICSGFCHLYCKLESTKHCLWRKQHDDTIHSSRNLETALCTVEQSHRKLHTKISVWVSIWKQIPVSIAKKQTLSKVGDLRQDRPKGSRFNSYNTKA